MAPISTEGWAVVGLFVGCLVAGAVGLFTFSFYYRSPFLGRARRQNSCSE